MPQGLILKPTYRVHGNRPVVQLFGRLLDGPPFLVEDDRFRPYFFIRSRDAHRLAGEPGVVAQGTDLRDLSGEPVARVEVPLPAAVPRLRDHLERDGTRLLEADIRFAYRYLIDHGLRAAVEIDGESNARSTGLVYFRNPSLAAGHARPSLVRLSIDLETSPDANRILSAALVCGTGGRAEVEEVHVVSRDRIDHPRALIHGDEARLLISLASRIRELDPDLIVGWNVVDFDLRVLADRCEKLGLSPREFWLGRVDGPLTFQQDRNFTRQSRADIPGRIVLDGISLVRDAMRLPDYRLETVARAVLGRGKLIDHDAPDSATEILRLYNEDPVSFAAYNLEDARLVPEILDHEGLLELALERSLLSGMQLDRIGASIASFDLLYLPELRKRGIVAPNVDSSRKLAPVKGGAVLEPHPGVASNVAVFDFKSLYPSLVRTFNLDPLALDRSASGDDPDLLEAPNGARFCRHPAILPQIIERFMERRERARERGDRHADQAIKIMMNAMFGVFAASACRFFDPQIANAITGFGQQTLAWTRDAFESEGVPVLYGDTDSVFVAIDVAAGTSGDTGVRPRALARASELRERVERRIADRIRSEYAVEPLLTLELEQVFDRFLLPRVRGGKQGSKKRYAGSIEGRIEIVGLEAVRRDWPAIAGRLQRGMLSLLFSDRAVLPFVRQVGEDLMSGKLDTELVYVKRIRKGTLDRYTASTPPHIQAARKASGKPGPVIRYVITRTGPEPVEPGGSLPQDLDRRHYLERVVAPIADAILRETGQSFDEAMGRPRQLDLL